MVVQRMWGARLAALTFVLLLAVAGACGGDKKTDQRGAQSVATSPAAQPQTFAIATPSPVPEATAEAPQAAQEQELTPRFPTPSVDAQLTRLVIPKAKVNAPLQTKGVNARNEMENPDGKDNVAWYNFTSRPGFGSNAVFSGHVDWFTGEAGVFWWLRDLREGDEVVLKLSDGTELKYRVISNEVWGLSDAPVAEIVGPTTTEVVTLITCEGTFNRAAQEYEKRRVVRAERVA